MFGCAAHEQLVLWVDAPLVRRLSHLPMMMVTIMMMMMMMMMVDDDDDG